MEIRDIPVVIELEQVTFGVSLGNEMLLNEITKNEVARYYILEENGDIVGYFGSWVSEPIAEIVNFLIIKEKRGQGFGEKLLDYAIEQMIEEKIKLVSLEVRESNYKAIALYEKKGFVKAHIRKQYYADNEDAIVMMKNM